VQKTDHETVRRVARRQGLSMAGNGCAVHFGRIRFLGKEKIHIHPLKNGQFEGTQDLG
jgi:hypothetical protein